MSRKLRAWSTSRTWPYNLQLCIEAAGMHCHCADDFWVTTSLTASLASFGAPVFMVADLRGKNPNVFYEAGIAHTFGRDTILVAQSMDGIPFDLRSIRTLQYLNNGEGRGQLAEGFAKRLQALTHSS